MADTMAREAAAVDAAVSRPSKTPATVAMWLGYALAGIGFALAGKESNAADALEPVVIWSVGALGVISFVRHALLHRSDAARMGWDLGRRNNFQLEVGMANLAWGLAAIGAVAFGWGVRAEATITLVFAIYLLQAFVLHVVSKFDGSEERHGAASWVPTLATLALTIALAYYAIAALSDAGARPFA